MGLGFHLTLTVVGYNQRATGAGTWFGMTVFGLHGSHHRILQSQLHLVDSSYTEFSIAANLLTNGKALKK